jgi:DNA-binding protein HU-beta
MNKKDLIAKIAREAKIKKSSAAIALKAMVAGVKEILLAGGKISLTGLGTFVVKPTKPRQARNLKTGEVVQVPASRRVSFRPSIFLKRDLKKK